MEFNLSIVPPKEVADEFPNINMSVKMSETEYLQVIKTQKEMIDQVLPTLLDLTIRHTSAKDVAGLLWERAKGMLTGANRFAGFSDGAGAGE